MAIRSLKIMSENRGACNGSGKCNLLYHFRIKATSFIKRLDPFTYNELNNFQGLTMQIHKTKPELLW
jgi:hypothetical protein